MKPTPSLKLVLCASAAALLVTGCVTHEVRYQPAPVVVQGTPPPPGTEIVVTEPPPPPIQETITVAPGPEYVWVSGAWAWRGHWVWGRGHWVGRPNPGAVGAAPHY